MRGSASPKGRSRMRSPPIGVRDGDDARVRGGDARRCARRRGRAGARAAPRARASALGVGNEGDELALVRDEQRIEAEDLAGAAHARRATGMARSSTSMPSSLARGDLDQRRGHAAARRIAHRVDVAGRRASSAATQLVQRRGVARELAVELEALALRTGSRCRDRRSVPETQDRVARRARARDAELDARRARRRCPRC